MGFNVVGISALYHDSACCILKDGVIKAAVQEERFTRKKNDFTMPINSFMYCLKESKLTINDIDCIAFYDIPEDKLSRQIWSGFDYERKDLKRSMEPYRAEREIRDLLGFTGHIEYIGHHLSHGASSYFFSGFDRAAIMTIDGVGEWDSTTYGYGYDHNIDIFEKVEFPHSIGLFYSTITNYLGFKVNSGEYKVMGLAPYGKPIFVDKIRKLINIKAEGQYELEMEYFDFIKGNRMYSEKLIELMGQLPRVPETEISQFHKDIARSLQFVLEEVLMQKINFLFKKTETKNLCLAGGVALNCVANSHILKNGPFKRLFVQPASGDSGGAIGAAAVAHVRLTGKWRHLNELEHVYLGPEYSYFKIKRILSASSLNYDNYHNRKEELINITARLIAEGKVIGWYQGKMEFGPRALGARSILADPRDAGMRDLINSMVKKREGFRPFAPAVLEEKMKEHFDLDYPSPFMLRTCNVISPIDLPAITHVDGSARVQTVNERTNPLFYNLICEFQKLTGCPILLNTSFNVRGEPIVLSPFDALNCFVNTKIDYLVLGDFIIDRSKNSMTLLRFMLNNFIETVKTTTSNMYTFI